MTSAHLPRPRYPLLTELDLRRRHRLVRRVVMRRADTGAPVEVLVPTLRGRLVMVWRAWTR